MRPAQKTEIQWFADGQTLQSLQERSAVDWSDVKFGRWKNVQDCRVLH